jgi:hypothetical protein
MSQACGTQKERPFGTWKCKQIGCKELQKDPEYESSPMRCTVLNTIPGNCHCCVKDLDPTAFIRVARGMIYNGLTNFNGPAPGIKNCPAECPYKLVDKKDNGKGRLVTTARCAFHGDDIKAWPLCPCDVLGNPRQEDQIKRLQIIVSSRLKNTNPTIGLCNMGICPDGKNRGGPNTDDDLCPVIRLPFDEINIGMGCPLWRIPAKMLPAGRAMTREEMQEAHDRVTREAFEKESLPGGVLSKEKKKPATKVEKKVPISALEQPKNDTKGESASRKITPKKKKECVFRQVSLDWFNSRKRKAAVVTA